MKRKEKKQLAEKITKFERIVQSSTDKKEIKKAQNSIVELSSHVDNITDIIEIDEIVQDLLTQSS
jgi:hypothetical protein